MNTNKLVKYLDDKLNESKARLEKVQDNPSLNTNDEVIAVQTAIEIYRSLLRYVQEEENNK